MKRLGKAVHLSRNRKLILRLKPSMEAPTLGEAVFNSDLNQVGIIDDIFGPVRSPYVAVKLSAGDPSTYIGKPLYAMRRSKSGKS